MKKAFFILLLTGVATKLFCQKNIQLNFFGINPSVTVEPYYESGELDINIIPLVYQRSLTKRMDLRATSILNYGIRNGSDLVSHFGVEAAVPVFILPKESRTSLSRGFFVAPIVSLTRNNERDHTNVGLWIEPGYNFLFENRFALSIGLQLGGTYFFYDVADNNLGSHFGFKVVFGKWF